MINLKEKPTIYGEKVILRPFINEDINNMLECLEDPEVLKFTGSTDSLDTDMVIQWYKTRNEQEDRLDLAITNKESEEVVGEVVLNEYNNEKHSMNFRILIGPKGRNQGFGSEAMNLFLEYIFTHTDLNQITLGVYAFNKRAQHVYEKLGFVLESIDKDDLEFEGEMIDSFNMILTRENWIRKDK
jgi:RimJ/RimL family protein N-acetyltransferase